MRKPNRPVPPPVDRVADWVVEITRSYSAAHLKFAMLQPLLDDEELVASWDGTPGALGLQTLRYTLFTSALIDFYGLLFDNTHETASCHHVAQCLKDEDFVVALKVRLFAPSDLMLLGDGLANTEQRAALIQWLQEFDVQKTAQQFDAQRAHWLDTYNLAKGNSIAERARRARNKIIAHPALVLGDEEHRRFEPADMGLKWSDVPWLMDQGRALVPVLHELVTSTAIHIEPMLRHQTDSSLDFWARTKSTSC